jgi:DNA-binding NarL/FixJ family response regulator
MEKPIEKRTENPEVAALRLAMARLGWGNRELATQLGVTTGTVENNFANDFSSKAMRQKANAILKQHNQPAVFTEGVGILEGNR